MSVTYDNNQIAIFNQVFRLLVTAGVNLPSDLMALSDAVDNITAALGGPDSLAQDTGSTSGLNYYWLAGRINTMAAGPISIAANHIALSDGATNYVECDAAGTVSKNTLGFTAGRIPMAVVTTASGAITGVTDKRPFMTLITAGSVGTSSLADGAATGVKLANAGETLQLYRQVMGTNEASNFYAPGVVDGYIADGGGYLIGMSARLSQALTGGTCLIKPTINGVAVAQTGLNLLLDGSNPQSKYATVAWAANAAYAYNAGDRLGMLFVNTGLLPDITINAAGLLRFRRS